MNTGVSHHVVSLARIDEEVGLCASFHAGVEELQGVLRNNRRVVHTYDYLQLTLQVLCLVKKACLLVAFSVLLRCVHIALAIHHLIPFPVDDRSSCHAHLEHFGMVAHQCGGHKSAEAPSVDADAVLVNVRQRL